MKDRYFLGLDGGGTKTHCVLYDRERDELYFGSGGATNHEVLPEGMEGLPAALLAVISPLLGRAGIAVADIDAASFGIGGVDTPMQHDAIEQMLSSVGFGRFVLSNDAYLGVKAEIPGGVGVSAVNGSGYSVAGIGPDGEMLQIGGHGDMSGDKGGGGYLVPRVVSAAYAELFKKGRPTVMTAMLRELAGARTEEEFCQSVALYIMSDSVAAYGAVSRILYKASAAGDEVAREILTGCGRDYALAVGCVAQRLGMPQPVDVVLIGSQFTRCEDGCAIEAMRRALAAEGDFRLHIISTEPVAGALFWALELAGIKLAGDARERACRRIAELGRCANE